MFAKIFDHETYGQLLVKVDSYSDGAPEVRTYFEPEGLGVCSVAVSFEDDKMGWDRAVALFEATTLETASKLVEGVLDKLNI